MIFHEGLDFKATQNFIVPVPLTLAFVFFLFLFLLLRFLFVLVAVGNNGADLQNAMTELLEDRNIVLAVCYTFFFWSIPNTVLSGLPMGHMYLGIYRAVNSSLYALSACIKYKTYSLRADKSFEKRGPIQTELVQG